MSTISETTTCFRCGFQSDDHQAFVLAGPQHEFVCADLSACKRRQKRDAILATPYVHPIDRFAGISVAICLAFFIAIIIGGIFFWMGR